MLASPRNFVMLLANSTNFVKLLTNFTNFLKCFPTSTDFVKLLTTSKNFVKGWFRQGNFQVRFDRLTFLENLYITTTLLSRPYLQYFCITTICLQRPCFSGLKSGRYIQVQLSLPHFVYSKNFQNYVKSKIVTSTNVLKSVIKYNIK